MRWFSTALVMALAPLAGAQEAPPLATGKDKLSYAMGMDLGAQLKSRSVDIDPAVFARGLGDALSGRPTLLTDAQAKEAISELQKVLAVRLAEVAKAAGEKNRVEGEAFLAANGAKEGVAALPSGLQYKILSAGTGPKPTLEDSVVCQYRVRLVDGKEVDSSYKRGQPITMPVRGGIKGWTEAVQLMTVGSKWEVYVPPSLGYGERGAGEIGPNSTLIFEIELVGIK